MLVAGRTVTLHYGVRGGLILAEVANLASTSGLPVTRNTYAPYLPARLSLSEVLDEKNVPT